MNKGWSPMLLGLTLSALAGAGHHVVHATVWSKESDNNEKVLVPLRNSWNFLPVRERAGLAKFANERESLSNRQPEVTERLVAGTTRSGSGRNATSNYYRQYRSLPLEKRRELMNKWKKHYLG